MRAILLPAVFALLGLAVGVGAGLQFRPAAEGDPVAPPPPADAAKDYVRLANQFVVPVVREGRVSALVILTLSIEVTAGSADELRAREPRLRDALLRVLFDHANAGGFHGSFTDGEMLAALRMALREAAVRVLGPSATDVLIMDLVRQDN
jgi:flagellar basal body-associated protein FliL